MRLHACKSCNAHTHLMNNHLRRSRLPCVSLGQDQAPGTKHHMPWPTPANCHCRAASALTAS